MTDAIIALQAALNNQGVAVTAAQIEAALVRSGVRLEMTGKAAAEAHFGQLRAMVSEGAVCVPASR